MCRIVRCALMLSVLAGCAPVHPSGRDLPAARKAGDEIAARALADRFDSLRRDRHIPGLAVVVLRDTRVILARGLGLADVERGIAVTPDTPFNIASVAKPISAIVALRLVQDGLLDLDRPIREYRGFAEFCEEARAGGGIFFSNYECRDPRLTLRHVMSMTANGEPGTRF